MLQFEILKPGTDVGYLPYFINDQDQRSAKEQFDNNYRHGGGWNPFVGFSFDQRNLTILFPGDPPIKAVARARFREETILVFPHSWVMVLEPDGTWEICRMD